MNISEINKPDQKQLHDNMHLLRKNVILQFGKKTIQIENLISICSLFKIFM